jgi:hypothetical protein
MPGRVSRKRFRCFSRKYVRGNATKYVRVRPPTKWPGEPVQGYVHLDLGYCARGPEYSQYVLLTPSEARETADALVKAAAEAERLLREKDE